MVVFAGYLLFPLLLFHPPVQGLQPLLQYIFWATPGVLFAWHSSYLIVCAIILDGGASLLPQLRECPDAA